MFIGHVAIDVRVQQRMRLERIRLRNDWRCVEAPHVEALSFTDEAPHVTALSSRRPHVEPSPLLAEAPMLWLPPLYHVAMITTQPICLLSPLPGFPFFCFNLVRNSILVVVDLSTALQHVLKVT